MYKIFETKIHKNTQKYYPIIPPNAIVICISSNQCQRNRRASGEQIANNKKIKERR